MSSGFGRRRRSRRRTQPEFINFQRRTRDRAQLTQHSSTSSGARAIERDERCRD